MSSDKNRAVQILYDRGEELFNRAYERIEFAGVQAADDLLNDLEQFPHAFVLACIMDRRIQAERAWNIPYEFSQVVGHFDVHRLGRMRLSTVERIFQERSLHRYNETMAELFYSGARKIVNDYDGDASTIWRRRPASATVVMRFLEFKGIGPKIGTMAANILAREFKVKMKDRICLDISADRHIKRVFKRLGLISGNASNEVIVYKARELNPEYPGVFDLSIWEIGRQWCRPKNPSCTKCYLNRFCPKLI